MYWRNSILNKGYIWEVRLLHDIDNATVSSHVLGTVEKVPSPQISNTLVGQDVWWYKRPRPQWNSSQDKGTR